jgi:periplasmic copper chaperone A
MRRWVILVTVMLISACGAGESTAIAISDARLGEPTGPNAALYLTVTTDAADRLLGASTDAAASVELHETTSNDDGTVSMQPAAGFDVAPDEALVLEPGGKHAMLIDADRLAPGDSVEVVLVFESAGEVTVTADVVDPQDVLTGGEEHDER